MPATSAHAAGNMARMSSQDDEEQQIIRSWHSNAAPWAHAIRVASIVSRKLVTDQAIIHAVSSVSSARILDIGCGEGWLARALSNLGMSVTGVDVVPELITQAAASRDAASAGAEIARYRLGQCGVSGARLYVDCEPAVALRSF
jgi:2-polyprenyl-3-methyl-5-hydroxy-6-metoxy-1,4-benzoquinol methylase